MRGRFTPAPLTFDYADATHEYAGRGRWSIALSHKVHDTGTVPHNRNGTWVWEKATEKEMKMADDRIANITTRMIKKQSKKLANKIVPSVNPALEPVAELETV
jgi:hypothetical protein